MKNKAKSTLISILRILPLLLCLAAMILYFIFVEKVTVDELLNFAPDNPYLAAIFLVALYAFKSLTIFFPIIILNILGGFLFSPPIALLINTLGVIIELAIPYFIGRISKKSKSRTITIKYPKIESMIERLHTGSFFTAFILRAVSCLPGDAVSIFLGATKMPFVPYLLGSLIGTLPGMILATFMGMSITDPASPTFWISTALTIALSVISVLIYWLYIKSAKRKEKEETEC